MRGQAQVVGPKNQPGAILADEVGDGGISIRIPAGIARHRCLWPDQQIGVAGQGLFGEVD